MNYTYNLEEMINLLDDDKDKKLVSYKDGIINLVNKSNDSMDEFLGKHEDGDYFNEPLSLLSPLLITGCTGTGKTNLINNFITTLIMRYSPSDLKLVLIDIKQVELHMFDSLPHLYCPRITDSEKAIEVLDELILEKNRRLDLLKNANLDSLYQYNQDSKNKKLPKIAIFIDEYIDIMASRSEFKDKIISLISDAFKVGIYLVMSTQNPDKKSLPDDLLKHFINRASFKLSSKKEFERIMLFREMDELKNKGDMYIFISAYNLPFHHIQTPYISYDEIDKIVKYIKKESN